MKYFLLTITFLVSLNNYGQTETLERREIIEDSLASLLNRAFDFAEIEGDDKSALIALSKAEELSRTYPYLKTPFLYGMSSLIRASTLYSLGESVESLALINAALEHGITIDSKKIKSLSYNILGNINITLGNLEEAKTYLLKSLDEIKKVKPNTIDDKVTSVIVDEHKIDLYYSLAQLEYMYYLGWRYDEKPLDKDTLKQKFKNTIFYAKKSLKYIRSANAREGRNRFMYVLIGSSYTNLGKLELSKKYLDSIRRITNKEDNLNSFRVHFALGELYEKEENPDSSSINFKKAYYYSRKYTDERVIRYQNKINNEINFLTKSLKGDLLVADINLKRSERFKNIISILLILLVLLGLALYSIFQRKIVNTQKKANRKLLNTNKILNDSINKRNQLEVKIANIQNHIGRDLHDNFGNRLAGIGMSSQILKDIIQSPEPDNDEIEKFLSNLDKGISRLDNDIKDLIWANNQNNNTLSKLLTRLKIHIKESYDNIKPEVKLNVYSDFDYKLPKFWNRQILLIVKEAINNSYKHSKSNQISIDIHAKNKILNVICKDDGVGFDIKKNSRLSGLSNMKKRIESIDCDIQINSLVGKGTTITFTGIIED